MGRSDSTSGIGGRSARALACIGALLVLALSLSSCTGSHAGASSSGGASESPTQKVSATTPVAVKTATASLTGAAGSMAGAGSVTFAPAAMLEAVPGIASAGAGVDVTFQGTQPVKDLTFTMAPAPRPAEASSNSASPSTTSTESLMPVFVHREDDGTLTFESAKVDAQGWFVVSTHSFSPRWPAWLNPKKWVTTVFDSVADSIGGRTDPLPCSNNGPKWASLEKKTTMVHTCLTSTQDSKKTMAQVRLQSNRRFWTKISTPTGAKNVRADGAKQLATAILAAIVKDKAGNKLVPGEGKLVADFYQAEDTQNLTFTAYQDGDTVFLSMASSLIATFGGLKITENRVGTAAAWALLTCHGEIPRHLDDGDGWWHAMLCVFGDALPQLADPRKALTSAVGLKNMPLSDDDVSKLSDLSSKLQIVGKVFKVAGLAFLVRDIFQQIPDTFSAMGNDRTGDVHLTLKGSDPNPDPTICGKNPTREQFEGAICVFIHAIRAGKTSTLNQDEKDGSRGLKLPEGRYSISEGQLEGDITSFATVTFDQGLSLKFYVQPFGGVYNDGAYILPPGVKLQREVISVEPVQP